MKQNILRLISQGIIKRKTLLLNVNLFYPDLTDRKMRLLIAELIADGEPIASSEKGYSIIKSPTELTEAVNYLKSKSKSIAIRANTLIGNYDLKYQDAPANIQLKIF